MKRCAKHGHRLCVWCFVQTAAFPLEHFVWVKLPLFKAVTAWMGV